MDSSCFGTNYFGFCDLPPTPPSAREGIHLQEPDSVTGSFSVALTKVHLETGRDVPEHSDTSVTLSGFISGGRFHNYNRSHVFQRYTNSESAQVQPRLLRLSVCPTTCLSDGTFQMRAPCPCTHPCLTCLSCCIRQAWLLETDHTSA